jgi:hypothetical protein
MPPVRRENEFLTRVALILYERLGNWVRQLRPRLHDQPVRWFETRTAADLENLPTGLARPVVLIDLGKHPLTGLAVLEHVFQRSPDAWVLVLDPECQPGVPALARELGAIHVISGFVPPPRLAELLRRWITLTLERIDQSGWSSTAAPESETMPWGWLADYLGDPESADSSAAGSLNYSRPSLPTAGLPENPVQA